MGGGFGIPYFSGDRPLDIAAVGRALGERFAALPAELAGTEFAIELGRYLVGEAGVYLTRIVDRKVSHGTTYLVTDGGLHHQLAASGNFGTVVRRNYPLAIASRFAAEPEEEANVVGCLCTPLDRLADQAMLPRAEVGDLVAVFCAGAYGSSASPAAFLGQGPAREMLVEASPRACPDPGQRPRSPRKRAALDPKTNALFTLFRDKADGIHGHGPGALPHPTPARRNRGRVPCEFSPFPAFSPSVSRPRSRSPAVAARPMPGWPRRASWRCRKARARNTSSARSIS
jgi:hypothetical protein